MPTQSRPVPAAPGRSAGLTSISSKRKRRIVSDSSKENSTFESAGLREYRLCLLASICLLGHVIFAMDLSEDGPGGLGMRSRRRLAAAAARHLLLDLSPSVPGSSGGGYQRDIAYKQDSAQSTSIIL